jgi:hypothetical protein
MNKHSGDLRNQVAAFMQQKDFSIPSDFLL